MPLQAGCCVREHGSEPLLALDQRPRPEILAVEIEEIEQEEDEGRRVAAVGSELNDVKERLNKGRDWDIGAGNLLTGDETGLLGPR